MLVADILGDPGVHDAMRPGLRYVPVLIEDLEALIPYALERAGLLHRDDIVDVALRVQRDVARAKVSM